MKPVITRLVQTCSACPAQWNGYTADGRRVYIRYRWGVLYAEVSESQEELYRDQIGDEYDGSLGTEEMQRCLADVLNFALDAGGPGL